MELIERYLQAVKFWLPAGQKDDIIAELSEDMHAQIEEQESALGHKLSEAEVEAILMRRGRPVLVANRFLPQEQLIGPVLFPIYRFVLKIVMLCYLVPWGLTWIGMVIYNPTFRASHSGHSWIEAAGSLWSALWSTAFLAVGTVTIVFAVLERVEAKTHFLEKWDPRKLPAVRHPNVIPRSGSVVEVAANLVFILWWATNMYSPIAMIRPDVQISVSPLWPWFFWSLLLSASGNIALASVNLTRPYWTGGRASLRLIADCIGSAVFCCLLKANVLTGIVVANIPAERTVHLTDTLNTLMVKAFPVSVVVCVVIAGADVYRIVRLLKTTRLRLTSGSAMIAA